MSEPLALGIDLGGTALRVALVDRGGRVRARRQTETDATGGPHAVLDQIAALVAELPPAPLAGAGIGAPGPLDPEQGICFASPTLQGWRNVPLAALLAERLGLPVGLENDANAAALGEWWAGAGQGLRHLVYVTVSTGIGGGVITEGRILHGRRGMAAEIGHMSLGGTEPCVCGGQGCWEAVAAGPALARAARAALATGAASALRPLGAALNGRDVTDAARAGDALALAVLRAEAALLGRGFANLLHLYSPEAIITGGGVADAFDLLLPHILATMQGQAMPSYRDVPVLAARLGGDAGLVGAASLVWPGR